MVLSHLLEFHASEPYKNAAPIMEKNCNSLSQLSLTIRACNDLPPVFAKMRLLHLRGLHLIIEEAVGDEQELMSLYRLVKLCSLLGHPLESFSVTYYADNEDDVHNSVRLMAIVGLLNQLNWDVCKTATLNLNINYLQGAHLLELIEELPVIMNIHGKEPTDEDLSADQAQLKMLELSYPYLRGTT